MTDGILQKHIEDLGVRVQRQVWIRVVESKSLKVGKSLKIGKKSDEIGKIGFDFLLDFWQKKYLISGDQAPASSGFSISSRVG